jgi:predicted GNAT family acetyltransferase
MREAIQVLDQVRDPLRPAPGELRLPYHHERRLMVEWMGGFAGDVGVIPLDQVEAMVEGPLARDSLFVWDDDGPVSMLVISPPVSDVVRIGPVYTPPERRRRGYATSMVAAASRKAFADGAAKCMLFTDLSNPTSNKIYAEIGYRRVADWEEHVFDRTASR